MNKLMQQKEIIISNIGRQLNYFKSVDGWQPFRYNFMLNQIEKNIDQLTIIINDLSDSFNYNDQFHCQAARFFLKEYEELLQTEYK